MLYEAVRLGCYLYHKNVRSYNDAYGDYLRRRDAFKWDNPERLDPIEVGELITFANRWNCRMPSGPENTDRMLDGLKRATPSLNLLRHRTLLDIRFDEMVRGTTASQLIARSFDQISGAGLRLEKVATSKMVHVAFNPDLFVMWDNAIMRAYDCQSGDGRAYAETFLPKMQRIAESAIGQAMTIEGLSHDDAVASLAPCQQSLAKVLDEFNYAKFTLEDPRVRQTEQRPTPTRE